MTREEFMKHAADAAYLGDTSALRGYVREVFDELERLRAEVEVLRGVGCREVRADEPESGPCGVCLRCAEERGAAWALDAALVVSLEGGTAFYEIQNLDVSEICKARRER